MTGDIFTPQAERLIIQGAVFGLTAGAAELQAADRATSAYVGVTGATRAASVCFVAGEGVESSGIFAAAVAEVESHNPAHVEVNSVPIGDDELAVILTTPTDYAIHLERNYAGARAHLGPTMDAHAPSLTQHAAEGIAGVLR
jgi:hypothetical protein